MKENTIPKLFLRNRDLYYNEVALREKDLGIWQRVAWRVLRKEVEKPDFLEMTSKMFPPPWDSSFRAWFHDALHEKIMIRIGVSSLGEARLLQAKAPQSSQRPALPDRVLGLGVQRQGSLV